jgi:Flp pilus assembly protein TadG
MKRGSVLRIHRRGRRGNALVEFAIIAVFCFTLIFGIIEFTWISTNRGMLMNGCARAARHGAINAPGTQVQDLKNDVRSYSALNVADSYIQVQVNSADDGSGSWSDATDAGTGKTIDVPAGRPIRVRVNGWPYHLLSGRFFAWLPGVSRGNMPLSAGCVTRREL